MQSLHNKISPDDNISSFDFSKIKLVDTEIQFTDEQLTKLQNIKDMFRSAQKVKPFTVDTIPEKKVVDLNFYKTLAYISTILFPIIGSYLQYYLYVIYVYFRRFFKKSNDLQD